MVVCVQRCTEIDLHLIEIQEHTAGAGFPLDDNLDLIGVSVELPALGVSGQEVGAVDMICDTEFQLLFTPKEILTTEAQRS